MDKILIVDDNRDFREELVDYLEDYETVEASSGEEALGVLKKPNEISLVILDVRMPGESGTKILKEIKSIFPDMGVVILTGYSTKDTALEALKGRADDYIEKPANIERIKEVIEKILREKRGDNDLDSEDISGKVERVKRFVQRNIHKKVTLEDAADAVCLSPKYLSRIFKKYSGTRFSDYRLHVKMEKAKELLVNTGCSVNTIADKIGFQNSESFMRIFKKVSSFTPTQYRQNNRLH
jgi:YesN/AraC family two-component response regulator